MGSPALIEWLRYYRDLGVDCLAVPKTEVVQGKRIDLEELNRRILTCKQCPLHRGRRNAVPGEGPQRPVILFIGEGPGEQEDRVGRPFVGKAGQLLDRLIERMGHSRKSVFIGNIFELSSYILDKIGSRVDPEPLGNILHRKNDRFKFQSFVFLFFEITDFLHIIHYQISPG